ncbi:FeS assembly ATPase SufC [Plasmodium yoelii 17X]|uniref:FeS assembly ATPase SufC n=1 Tax=Plasmodium yoelii 17X TaxID=1323249 RepID=V7PKM0_PLAYE|nr:FeS assembly ATPase SufC [Plasmodium yoelii 17X]
MQGQFWLAVSYYIITIICKVGFCIKFIENEKNLFGFKSKKKISNIKVRDWDQKEIQPFFIINKVKNKKYNNLKKSLNMEYSNTDDQRLSLLKNLEDKSKIITQAPDWNEKMPLLEINDLHAIEVEGGKEILKGINLTIYLGEKHSIMGRNGSGKSTLAKVIAGHPYFKVTKGSMKFKGLNLTELAVNHRSLCGIFLAFQYPIELPMVKNNEFLRTALNCHRRQNNEPELSPSEFDLLMINEIKKVGLSPEFLDRPVNYGFSGGEKKRNEILQMLILKPSFCILDETDSGLDVDSFKLTSDVIQNFSNINNSFLIVTHYKKLLELLKPNYIHIMHKGEIIKTGDYSLVDKIESDGYAQFVE